MDIVNLLITPTQKQAHCTQLVNPPSCFRYDLSTLEGIEATFSELEDVVGLEYLKAFHLNDKNGNCDDHLDRHEVLGEGCIKLPVFKYLVKRFPNIPMVLETPDENKWADELVILRELFSGE